MPARLRSDTRDPETPEGVEAALRALGVRPDRRLGQSFLVDPFVADAEAALAADGPSGGVLEIGPGLGILTRALLRRGLGPISVLERDPRLARYLQERFAGQVDVIQGDARTAPWPAAPVVVGNLPFSVATPIVIRLLRDGGRFGVFLLQREVAERLAAGAGSRTYGRLSILAALYGRVRLFQVVPARAFSPVPRVDGQLVSVEPRSGPLPVPDPAKFERLVRTLFARRRKQLKNLLPGALPHAVDAERAAEGAEWPTGWGPLRPEELPPDAYFRLATWLDRSHPPAPR